MLKMPDMKYVSRGLGVGFVVIGIFLAGAGLAPYLQQYNPYAPKQALHVKPVQTSSIDPYARRTQELCATSADLVQKMRDELKDMRAKAAAKIAPK